MFVITQKNKFALFLIFIALQLLGVLVSLISYFDCKNFKQDIAQTLLNNVEWTTYYHNQIGCSVFLGMPSPIVYLSNYGIDTVIWGLLFNIFVFFVLTKIVIRCYHNLKNTKGENKVSRFWNSVKIALTGSFFIYTALYVSSIVYQMLLRMIRFYDQYAGGPSVYYQWNNFYVFIVAPIFLTGFYNIKIFILFLLGLLLVLTLIVYYLIRHSGMFCKKRFLLYLFTFFIWSVIFINFTHYLSQGIIDLNCRSASSSACDG